MGAKTAISAFISIHTCISYDADYDKALKLRGKVIVRPKKLGDIRGISYIYPILYRFGIIDVPEDVAGRMRGVCCGF